MGVVVVAIDELFLVRSSRSDSEDWLIRRGILRCGIVRTADARSRSGSAPRTDPALVLHPARRSSKASDDARIERAFKPDGWDVRAKVMVPRRRVMPNKLADPSSLPQASVSREGSADDRQSWDFRRSATARGSRPR